VAALAAAVGGEVEGVYEYINPGTKRPDVVVVRYFPHGAKKKAFMQAIPAPNSNGFVRRGPQPPWPLYGRDRIPGEDNILVVEGEKKADVGYEYDIVAVSPLGGAGPAKSGGNSRSKAELTDWSPLAGRNVYLWPDKDDAGQQFMRDIAQQLSRLQPTPRVYYIAPEQMPELEAKGDIVDFVAYWMEKSGDRSVVVKILQDLLRDTVPYGPVSGLQRRIEDIIAGKYAAIDWPWEGISTLSQALQPGTVTILCGDPGSNKSFFLNQCAMHWHSVGVKCALHHLEDDKEFHLHRAFAQRARISNLFKTKYIQENAALVRNYLREQLDFLNGFGACFWDAPDVPPTKAEIGEWIYARAKEGARIIAVDPITAVMQQEDPWIEDTKLMLGIKAAARQYGVSIILVTHPSQGSKVAIGLHNLAGGKAFVRFAHNVIWIESVPDTSIEVSGWHDRELMVDRVINRKIHLCKARSGPGAGLAIGYYWDKATLSLMEQGIIPPKDKQRAARRATAEEDAAMKKEKGAPREELQEEIPL